MILEVGGTYINACLMFASLETSALLVFMFALLMAAKM